MDPTFGEVAPFLFPFFFVFVALNGSSASVPMLMAGIAAFYLGTAIFAAYMASRLAFRKYQLNLITNAFDAFLGCLVFWGYCFPYFLHNWTLVANKQAPPRQLPAKRLGFLVPGIIWNIIAYLFFFIFAPSMSASRIGANERDAIHSLEIYRIAQLEFKARGLGHIAGNSSSPGGYCDNFRNLYYGVDTKDGRALELIPKQMADAFAGPTRGIQTAGYHKGAAVASNGYLFLEDPYVGENDLWEREFGLVAYPQSPGETGESVFWIGGGSGDVRYFPAGEGRHALLTAEQSPLNPGCAVPWHIE